VMGGSLGGNMTFRLGRRPGVDWLPKFIVWSPASIWNSLGEGNDILKHLGPRKAWENANKAITSPGAGDRADFFGAWDGATAWPIIREAQSGTWTSEYYACKLSSVAGARLDRHETYDAHFLAWHWRLGAEQLLYSHQTNDPVTKKPRYLSNQKPMLLACGLEDQIPYNEICPATQKTAKFMTMTPGRAIFLAETGHSLDNERRKFFAQQILDFLK
jgi:pimeloyl-ACP methyl ester carboxylesterase